MRSAIRKVNRTAARRAGITRGQALVEMALVASIFLLLLVVAIEGGLALAMGHSFTVAAREAARRLTCGRTSDTDRSLASAEEIVHTSLAERFGEDSAITQNAVVTVAPDPGTAQPGSRITIKVAYALPQSWFINRSETLRIVGTGIYELQDTVGTYVASTGGATTPPPAGSVSGDDNSGDWDGANEPGQGNGDTASGDDDSPGNSGGAPGHNK